jgi:hypothetical protein
MPLAVESLNPDSTDSEIQTKISQSIETCMNEGGGDQKQCAAIAFGKAREMTGKELDVG